MLSQDKKGVSLMVSYVLLIVFAVVMGAIVFAWLRTYTPAEALNCPEGTSFFIRQSAFNDTILKLNLTLRNNGRFDIAGYFIHASNNSTQDLATIDLSQHLNEIYGGLKFGNSVLFSISGQNSFKPGDERSHIFNIPSSVGEPYSVNLIPTRFQEENNRERFVSCGDAIVNQLVGEAAICTPENQSITCGTWICGDKFNNCGEPVDCGQCTLPEVCDGAGFCVDQSTCSNTCLSLGFQCGNQSICGNVTDCGSCSGGDICSQAGQCVISCNGVWSPPESAGVVCDGGANCFTDCTCPTGYNPDGIGGCTFQSGGSFNSCGDYCDSFAGYNNVNSCVQNPSQCASAGKTYIGNVPGANETLGNSFCSIGNADTCCCTPG